jgi:outer membrane biosynthesis protein TonB
MATKKTTTKKTTVKKAATKKTVAKKAAVKKTVTKKTPATKVVKKATKKASAKKTAKVIAKKTTTIIAKCDIGFGNTLFIRGEGAGLGWEAGIAMENIDSETWTWSAEADSTVEAKVLINDDNWAAGSNTVTEPGETVTIEPSFG